MIAPVSGGGLLSGTAIAYDPGERAGFAADALQRGAKAVIFPALARQDQRLGREIGHQPFGTACWAT